MDAGLMLLSFFILLAVYLMLKTIHYYQEIQQKVKENPKGAITYGRNIVYGIVTGGSVIAIDRIINLIFEGFAKINLHSINFWQSFGSLLSLLGYTFFDVALMFFLIFYLIHKGLPAIEQNKIFII